MALQTFETLQKLMLEEIAKDTKLAYGEFAQKHFTATKPSATGRTGHLYAATLKDVQRQMQSLDRWQGVLADVDYGPIEQRAMAHASYAGMPVTLDINMTDSVIDWSRVRSPSRARRRQRNGKRKHWPMKYVAKQEVFKVGNRIIMHPEMWERLKRELGVMEHARP